MKEIERDMQVVLWFGAGCWMLFGGEDRKQVQLSCLFASERRRGEYFGSSGRRIRLCAHGSRRKRSRKPPAYASSAAATGRRSRTSRSVPSAGAAGESGQPLSSNRAPAPLMAAVW
ncbi:hypothetical protein SEVIR_5G402950v4 [Setaria viridis]|uniref:Uncharacterized protein n=1 Tax=Setaria viridis TaxID=4556 RepID=A0A4U6UTK1_SETVI|nr:hypothetical protein SEVIR_5G402950v2 [Setaria viridis]